MLEEVKYLKDSEVKYGVMEMPKRNNVQPTKKQKKFIAEVIKATDKEARITDVISQAIERAGYNDSIKHNPSEITQSRGVQKLLAAFEEQHLTIPKYAQLLKEGMTTDDLPTRYKYLTLFGRLRFPEVFKQTFNYQDNRQVNQFNTMSDQDIQQYLDSVQPDQ